MPKENNLHTKSLTGAQQTMMSWAKVIDSLETVPELFKDQYQALVGSYETIPYTLFVPALVISRGSISKDRILCEIGDTLYILEWAGNRVFTTGFRYQDIYSLELGDIFLYSWFLISGKTNSGAKIVLKIEYNKASFRHFEPFFSKMRPVPGDSDSSDLMLEQEKFNYLETENYKFMNLARASLVSGESVIQSIYQSKNRKCMITILGYHFYRTISLAHLTIVTDKEIILIGDVENFTDMQGNKYGGVKHYLPLRSIISVDIEKKSDDLMGFTFRILPDVKIERLFGASHVLEINNLKMTLETLLGKDRDGSK